MRFFANASIRRKQIVIVLLTSGITLLLACSAFIAYETRAFRDSLVKDVSVLAEVVGDNCAAALEFRDPASAAETLGALRAHENIVLAVVYDRDGEVFAEYRRNGEAGAEVPASAGEAGHVFSQDHLRLFDPIEHREERSGTIFVVSDLTAHDGQMKQFLATSGIVFGASLLIAFLLSRSLERFISGPILDLVRTTREVTEHKHYAIRAKKKGDDELGVLVEAFNEMLGQIEARDGELRAARDHLEARVAERTAALEREQARLKFIFDSVPMGIALRVVAPDGESTNMVNDVQWRICGVDPADQAHIEFFDLTHPDDRSRQDRLHRRLEAGEIDHYSLEKRYLRPDGGLVWVYFSVQRRRDPRGGFEDLSTVVDITELKGAQEEAAREQERLKFIFESVPVGISLTRVTSDGARRRMINEAHLKICGLDPDKEHDVGTFAKLTHPDDFARQLPMYERMERGESDRFSLEKRYVRPDGRTVWVVFSVQRRIDSAGGHEDLATVVDITTLREAQQEAAYERDLLRALLDNSPDYIYFKDKNSRFLKVSLFQARAFGVESSAEVEGKTDFDFFSEKHARDAFGDEQEIIRTGRPVIGKIEKESWKDRPGGFWVLTSKLPLRDSGGRIIGTFGISRDITELKEAEAKLEAVHQQLLETSRQAGMAEVATSVLHNVGNVLNTVNISASTVSDKVKESRVSSLVKVSALLREKEGNLAEFLTRDPKGQQVPAYLARLSDFLVAERDAIAGEMESLQKNIEHIKEIVGMQQSYARVSGVREPVALSELVEDSIRINGGALTRHGVEIVREFEENPEIVTERHKVMQILVNLIRNAKYACDETGRSEKRITLRLARNGETVEVTVADNGIGIPPENLNRIFNHGFSTRPDGHGFGLHSSALVAREMGGSLSVHSDGTDCGAAFTLTLPMEPS